MRQGELLGLRWQDVDLDNNFMYIKQALKRPGSAPVFGAVKTHRSGRPIAFGQELKEILINWRERQRKEKVVYGEDYREFNLVFTLKDGGPIHPRNLTQRHFKRTLQKAGISQAHVFHSLRHTSATLGLQSGIPAKVISEKLGHTSIGITLDTYTHYLPELQQEAATKTESLIFSPENTSVSRNQDCQPTETIPESEES